MNENVEEKKKYPLIDVTQYTASILVILVHCDRLLGNDLGHFFLKNVFCRLAVPLFLVISGFFYRERCRNNPEYYKVYFRRQIKQYFFWSLLYLPYGLIFISQHPITPVLYPVALLVGFFYVGICYHLWYIPALLLGLWLLETLHKKLNYWVLGASALILYGIGMFETYSSYLKGSFLEGFYTFYKALFFTTRNGIFYAFIFLLLGFLLADFKEHPFFKKHLSIKLFISSLLLSAEGWLIFQNQGDDKNFLFMLLPVSIFLVAWVQRTSIAADKNWHFFRVLSKYMYFLHPLILEISKYAAVRLGMGKLQGFPLFILTFGLTSGLIIGILMMKNRKDGPQRSIVYSKLKIFKKSLGQN